MYSFSNFAEGLSDFLPNRSVDIGRTTRLSRDKARSSDILGGIEAQLANLSQIDQLKIAEYIIQQTDWVWKFSTNFEWFEKNVASGEVTPVKLRDWAIENTINKVPYLELHIFVLQLHENSKEGIFPGFNCKSSCHATISLKQRGWEDESMRDLPGHQKWIEHNKHENKIITYKKHPDEIEAKDEKRRAELINNAKINVYEEVKKKLYLYISDKRLSKGHHPKIDVTSEPFKVDLRQIRELPRGIVSTV